VTYGSVCSGIEAVTAAWHQLGYRPAWFAEVAPFPSAVLAHHYPGVTNHGDFTRLLRAPPAAVDVLAGGTPCQSFSRAGLRGGLCDPRGNLALAYVALAGLLRPRWVVWENVPGVLSADRGDAFRCLLSALVEVGYGVCWRVLDAQWFGLAQRRERVFVVGYHGGDWRPAAAVLLEPEGVRRDSPPRREAGARVTGALGTGTPGGGGWRVGAGEDIAGTLDCSRPGREGGKPPAVAFQCHNSNPIPFDTTQVTSAANRSHPAPGDPCHPLAARAHAPAVAFQASQTGCREYAAAGTLRASGPDHDPVGTRSRVGNMVRRLTPRECERLQGFPDDYTLVPYRGKPAADGHRYHALGNSMAVPVMAWIGRRLLLVEDALSAVPTP